MGEGGGGYHLAIGNKQQICHEMQSFYVNNLENVNRKSNQGKMHNNCTSIYAIIVMQKGCCINC
jgi:hypothetical protein